MTAKSVTGVLIHVFHPEMPLNMMSQVLKSQVELVARYDLAHEVVGTGLDARLRILPGSFAARTQQQQEHDASNTTSTVVSTA